MSPPWRLQQMKIVQRPHFMLREEKKKISEELHKWKDDIYPYIFKADDDAFVNMYTLQKHLIQLDAAGYNKKFGLCALWLNMQVMRDDKWQVSTEEYPDEYYPPYCSGMTYLFSTDVAAKLYEASFFVRFFWVDDVYITGMLREKANVNFTSTGTVYCEPPEMADLFTERWHKCVFIHLFGNDTKSIIETWNRWSKMVEKTTILTPTEIVPGVFPDFYNSVDFVKN
ncbi:hypothetical protein CAPTEDRAFT_214885 [Capitella teleta]|uniref:Hexosyltransferase n=1 Tax=Capitella teleta TaxID=283909 RepID=R7U6D9_CAPTE|nr:hypothetical protein CAPTEDRAFT_214885 [Capitella teleta]|eukprot:ELU01686.1 hypothetical protein CAPTEDRAFT_214885 [Capitella teleta]